MAKKFHFPDKDIRHSPPKKQKRSGKERGRETREDQLYDSNRHLHILPQKQRSIHISKIKDAKNHVHVKKNS